jgi:hypothetical protein
MNDPIAHLYVLHNNPFLFASTLRAFYEILEPRPRSVLLAFLVLPIVLDPRNRTFLQRATSRSSLRTMLARRELLRATSQRVDDYRNVTIDTLKYLVSAHLLDLDGDTVLVNFGKSQLVDSIAPDGAVLAARKLAEFFQPFDVPTVYRLLGVMQL